MSQPSESRNLSIMITDIKGFSRMTAESSRGGIMNLIQKHTQLLTPAIRFFRGTIVKSMGDSFLATFESATDAAMCAIAIQLITAEYNKLQQDENLKLVIRAIINSGDVSVTKDDVYGEPVNVAARMEKVPHFEKGGIGISESTYLLMNRKEIIAKEVGVFEFKGVSDSVKVFSVDLANQKLEILPTKLLKLAEDVVLGRNITFAAEDTRPLLVRLFRGQRAVTALLALAIIGGGFAFWSLKGELNSPGRRSPKSSPGADMFLRMVRQSDANRDHEITREEWRGRPEGFAAADTNGDGKLQPNEIEARVEALGGSVGSPQ